MCCSARWRGKRKGVQSRATSMVLAQDGQVSRTSFVVARAGFIQIRLPFEHRRFHPARSKRHKDGHSEGTGRARTVSVQQKGVQ